MFFDIDGVLKLGDKKIPGAAEAIKALRRNSIPIRLITNNGGMMEYQRADSINKILNLNNEDSFKANEVIVSHTPIRSLVNTHKDELILVSGKGQPAKVMQEYGFTNYITVDELCRVNPNLISDFLVYESEETCKRTVNTIEERFRRKITAEDVLDFKFKSIFILSDVISWERNIQVMSYILASPSGSIRDSAKVLSENNWQKVDFVTCNNDTLYHADFHLSRMGGGLFHLALDSIFQRLYDRKITYKMFGKPSIETFHYAMRQFDSEFRFYMVGDNVESDIIGARNAKISSILVRTGVFRDKDYVDKSHYSDLVFDDVGSSVNEILKVENILI